MKRFCDATLVLIRYRLEQEAVDIMFPPGRPRRAPDPDMVQRFASRMNRVMAWMGPDAWDRTTLAVMGPSTARH